MRVLLCLVFALLSLLGRGQRATVLGAAAPITYSIHGFMDNAGTSALHLAGNEFGVTYHIVGGCYPLRSAVRDSVDRVNAIADSMLAMRYGSDAKARLEEDIHRISDELTLIDSTLSTDPEFLAAMDSLKVDGENLLKVDYEICGSGCYVAVVQVGERSGSLSTVSRMTYIIDRQLGQAYRR